MKEEDLMQMIEECKSMLVKDGKLDEFALIALCKQIEFKTRSLALKSIMACRNLVEEHVDIGEMARELHNLRLKDKQ